jgi:hypothetical protein
MNVIIVKFVNVNVEIGATARLFYFPQTAGLISSVM